MVYAGHVPTHFVPEISRGITKITSIQLWLGVSEKCHGASVYRGSSGLDNTSFPSATPGASWDSTTKEYSTCTLATREFWEITCGKRIIICIISLQFSKFHSTSFPHRNVMHSWCNTGITQISPFHFTSTWTASAFSVNLGFFRKSPRSRASSFSWQTLVSKCQTDFLIPSAWHHNGSWWIWLHFPWCPRAAMCKDHLVFCEGSRLVGENKVDLEKSRVWIHGSRVWIHSLWQFGAHLPHLLYQISSPCHGAQFCPENQIPIRHGARNPNGTKNTGGFAVLSSFIWGSLLIWNPKTSFTWNQRNQPKSGWTMIWDNLGMCGRCKHQPSSTNINPCWHDAVLSYWKWTQVEKS